MRRFLVLFLGRNKEFYRDKASLGWSFLFPLFILLGFSFIFERGETNLYKVAVVGTEPKAMKELFPNAKFVEFIAAESKDRALDSLRHHGVDMVIDAQTSPHTYWVSETSPKGFVTEKVLSGTVLPPEAFTRNALDIPEVPYLDWLFPGVLGMNLMFSALFGVGYVIVRYRKNGALKRLSVTPLAPTTFLSAHLCSRLLIVTVTTGILYVGCSFILDFKNNGSYPLLFLIFILGAAAMIAMGLVVAARTSSEELAGGLLNMASWPMMFLSEVWFSLEGAAPWVKAFASILPLTHLIKGARAVMNDGATFTEVSHHVMALIIMTVVLIGLGAGLFRWEKR